MTVSLWTQVWKLNFGMNYRIPKYIGVDHVNHNLDYSYCNIVCTTMKTKLQNI